jgi:hypothetical protein
MNREPLASAKLGTWWHLMTKLGGKCHDHLDTVVVPFLHFCYGRPTANEFAHQNGTCGTPDTLNGKGGSNVPTPPSSPVKKYTSMPPLCLDALAQILGCHHLSHNLNPRLEPKRNLFENRIAFTKHHRDIFHAVAEASEHANLTPDIEKLFKSVVATISNFVYGMTEVSCMSKQELEVVEAFFDLIHTLCLSMEYDPEFIVSMVLMAGKMPVNLLCSAKLWRKDTITPLLGLTKILFSLEPSGQNATFKKNWMDVMQFLLKKAIATKTYTLVYVGEVLSTITEQNKPSCKDSLLATWKQLAAAVKDHVDRHQEVDQSTGSGRIEHDLGPVRQVLALPLKWFKAESGRQPWKQWIELLKQISDAAMLVVSYSAPELEEYLAGEMLAESNVDKAPVMLFARLLATGIIPNVPFKNLKGISTTHEEKSLKPIGNIVQLTSKLLQSLPDITSGDVAPSAAQLCNVSSAILSGLTDQQLIRPVLRVFVPAVAVLFDGALAKNYGKAFEDAVDQLAESAFNLVQSRYTGPFNAALVGKLKPFLVATMGHEKRSLKTKAQQMWQLTFAASLKINEIPKEIADILRKSLVLSSESSQSQDSGNAVTGEPNSNGPLPTTFGSFLNRTPTKEMAKKDSIISASASSIASPFKNFKKPDKTTTTPNIHSLEDESSQDFVPITNSGKKRRVLTDHQKHKMTSRSHDIPALYSELSRDDSSVLEIPEQFDSQLSSSLTIGNEDDSQMAMDSSDFEKATAAKKDEEKYKKKSAEETLLPVESASTSSPPPVATDSDSSTTLTSQDSTQRRRKGKTPIKNLPPVTKRQSIDGRTTATPNLTSSSSVTSAHGSEGQVAKKKRGRPRKFRPDESSETSKADKKTVSATQMVKLKQMSPKNVEMARNSCKGDPGKPAGDCTGHQQRSKGQVTFRGSQGALV